jgi:hypothetical protein
MRTRFPLGNPGSSVKDPVCPIWDLPSRRRICGHFARTCLDCPLKGRVEVLEGRYGKGVGKLTKCRGAGPNAESMAHCDRAKEFSTYCGAAQFSVFNDYIKSCVKNSYPSISG